jgi:hypothetical protein
MIEKKKNNKQLEWNYQSYGLSKFFLLSKTDMFRLEHLTSSVQKVH